MGCLSPERGWIITSWSTLLIQVHNSIGDYKMMIKKTTILLVVFLIAGCAHLGQTSDVATTAIGIANGAAEANPLVAPLAATPAGLAGLLAAKLGASEWARHQDPATCYQTSSVLTALGNGAGMANAAVLAGFAGGPLSIPIVIGGGLLAQHFFDDNIRMQCTAHCRSPRGSDESVEDRAERCPAGWWEVLRPVQLARNPSSSPLVAQTTPGKGHEMVSLDFGSG